MPEKLIAWPKFVTALRVAGQPIGPFFFAGRDREVPDVDPAHVETATYVRAEDGSVFVALTHDEAKVLTGETLRRDLDAIKDEMALHASGTEKIREALCTTPKEEEQ